jgi:hypothetical protein
MTADNHLPCVYIQLKMVLYMLCEEKDAYYFHSVFGISNTRVKCQDEKTHTTLYSMRERIERKGYLRWGNEKRHRENNLVTSMYFYLRWSDINGNNANMTMVYIDLCAIQFFESKTLEKNTLVQDHEGWMLVGPLSTSDIRIHKATNATWPISVSKVGCIGLLLISTYSLHTHLMQHDPYLSAK